MNEVVYMDKDPMAVQESVRRLIEGMDPFEAALLLGIVQLEVLADAVDAEDEEGDEGA